MMFIFVVKINEHFDYIGPFADEQAALVWFGESNLFFEDARLRPDLRRLIPPAEHGGTLEE